MRRKIFNFLFLLFAFMLPIIQGYYSTISVDENKKFMPEVFLKSPFFWIILVLWLVFNIFEKRQAHDKKTQDESEMEKVWLSSKSKMIKDAAKKASKNDYSGAQETIKILEELDKCLKRGKNDD